MSMLENKQSVLGHLLKNSDNEYICFSSKFKKHFHDVLLNDHTSAFLTFLSGEAGTGKSYTLLNEYIIPLNDNNIKYFSFHFVPDKNIGNHFFLDNIIEQVIQFIKNDYTHKNTSGSILNRLEKLSGRLRGSNGHPFDYSETHKEFIKIISDISKSNKIVFTFEDIHLSRKSFFDFLDQVTNARHFLNIDILCTTRKGRSDHKLIPPSSNSQKWFYLENLSKNNFDKYLQSLKKLSSTNVIPNNDWLNLSDGNPFYIKELYLLNKQRDDNVGATNAIEHGFNLDHNDGKTSITSIRFSYLNTIQKKILKIHSILGHSIRYSELQDILNETEKQNFTENINFLKENGFIQKDGLNLRFRHHLIYEGVKNSIPTAEAMGLHNRAFRFLMRQPDRSLERLINHANEASLVAYASIFAKKLADEMYEDSQFDIASDYYDRYLEWVKLRSSPQKVSGRTIDALIPLHAACLILGKKDKAETISSYLANMSEITSLENRYKIYSTLSTAYWTVGDLVKAREYARKNIDNADALNLRDAKISTIARYGTLCMELGDFKRSLEMHGSALSYIQPGEHYKKFSMFVEAYACSKGIQSFCYFELGHTAKSQDLAHECYQHFSETEDLFTKLFISVHCGYSMAMAGQFERALKNLEIGIETREKMKVTLLVPAALSLVGLCNFYLGNTKEGSKNIAEAQELTRKTFQGSKKGIINICYAESLLINFDTDTFSEKIDHLIDEIKGMQQFSYVAWLYFYKAVYHAFFNRSIQGFVGSYAKASAIAQNLDMGTLMANLRSLSNLEESGLLNFKDEAPPTKDFFDKSLFFYNQTRNVKPISFHIDSRTRS